MAGVFKNKLWKSMLLAACLFVSAGNATCPFKTVPWNGYSGAASFTFDDGLYQIENLPQILTDMPQVKVSFFLSNMGVGLLDLYAQEFANFANMGNEIGNHSDRHVHLTSLGEADLHKNVTDFASQIEQTMAQHGASVSVTALALPFSANSETVAKVAGEHHFISRSSWGAGRHSWDTEPHWMDMDSRAWYSLPGAEQELLRALDTTAYIGTPSWQIFLNHGVAEGGENKITPAQMRSAFERAVQNNMWVAPLSTVGAYYRAHFTLDTANATANGDGSFTIRWELPHPSMPKSIPLKITLSDQFIIENFGLDAGIVLKQGEQIIYPDEAGIFTIEFCALSVTIQRANASISRMPYRVSALQSIGSTQKAVPAASAGATYTVHDMKGKFLGKTTGFAVPEGMPKGTYIVRAVAAGKTTIRKVLR